MLRLRVVENPMTAENVELGAFAFAVPPQVGHRFTIRGEGAGGWARRYTVIRIGHEFKETAPDDPATVLFVRRDVA